MNAKVLMGIRIAFGLAILFFGCNKFVPLMMLVLMSISVNALLYHLKLDPKNIVIEIIFVGLNAFMLYIYKDNYKELLKT